MDVSIIFPEESRLSRPIKFVKKLSIGHHKVYQTHCPSKSTDYALKIFRKDAQGTTDYDREKVLFNFSHPNIIKHIPAVIVSEKKDRYNSILTEFANHGDLFDLVIKGALDSEVLIRTYFRQIVAGLEYIHSQGIAHLDLKLENLMIGANFALKIIDFDKCQYTRERKITSRGTEGYRAPELIDGSCRNFIAADIYSLGIVLYALKAHNVPFTEETTQDVEGRNHTHLKHYSSFIRNNAAFWERKAAKKGDAGFYSEEFRELINGMLQFEVSERFTLKDVKSSKWFNGPVLSDDKLRIEMANLVKKV